MPRPTLIAEIGGSSSRWALLTEEGEDKIFPNGEGTLPGFNPLTGDPELFTSDLRSFFQEHCPEAFSAAALKVYGAGCGTVERKARMQDAIKAIWPEADIQVDTDLMAAARGLSNGRAGLVLILGTGMNAGYFDGVKLFTPMPSLGYILGDEGSGADIGAILIQDAFYDRMPADVKEMIFGPEGPDLSAIMEEVYRSAFPSRMLASRTRHLAPLLEHRYVRELILARFHVLAELLKNFFSQEQRHEVVATGSVAYGFHELLGECLLDHGMTLLNVEKDPLLGLIQYERQQ